jgi:hypothetical protein
MNTVPDPTIALEEALRDMLSGWVYIRHSYGDLYGVGWDRAQSKAERALELVSGDKRLTAVSTECNLLELAAKAAGYIIRFKLQGNGAGEAINYQEHEQAQIRWEESPTCFGYTDWNPLTDDGDRYRLAKALNIRLHFGANYLTCCVGGIARVVSWPEDAKDDAYAVVQAAALIGEAMP